LELLAVVRAAVLDDRAVPGRKGRRLLVRGLVQVAAADGEAVAADAVLARRVVEESPRFGPGASTSPVLTKEVL